MRAAAVVLISAILAGCGGGGSDSAVSASPPAGSPPSGSPAPVEPPASNPPAAQPPASQPPAAETPAPEAPEPPAPEPPAPPAPEPPAAEPPPAQPPAPAPSAPAPEPPAPAPGTFVTGDQLARALAQSTVPIRGGPGGICPTDGKSTTLIPYLYQTGNGTYGLYTGPRYDLGETPGICGEDVPWYPYGGYQRLTLTVQVSYARGSTHVSNRLDTTSEEYGREHAVTMMSATPFLPESVPVHAKNKTVHEWRSIDSNQPWFAQLQVHSDSRGETDPSRFKLCWHVRLPAMQRLVCHRFHDSDGFLSFTGLDVADDSLFGARTFSAIW